MNVPKGWKKGTFEDGVLLVSGQHIETKFVNEVGIGMPYLTGPADFLNGKIISTKFTDTPKVKCKEGDFLITVKGSGTGKIIAADKVYCISRQLMAVRAQKFDKLFTYYALINSTKRYEEAANGLIPGISRADVLDTPLIIPPLIEQQKIAKILSIWDKAIENQDALIAAKQKRKKALMQQILTGKKRFAGFEGRWKTYHLREVFDERNETGYVDLNLLSITREKGVIPRDEVERKDTSNDDKSKYLRICPGDIGYNTMRMWQGVSALSALEGIVSPAYTICTPKRNIDGKFAAYLFKTPPIVHLFLRYSQGLTSDTWNLKFHQFSEIKICIPEEIEEQQKIASVLSSADEEIETHQKQLSALKEQKKGLMQQLLTGKKRVKIDEPEQRVAVGA
jgi:type I restriction enzyme S subunit